MKNLLIMEKEYIYQEPSHSRGRTWLSNSKEAFEYNTWSDMQSKSREAHSITSNSVLCICYTHGHLLFCFSSNLSTSPHELIVSQSLSDFLGKWEASHCETKSVREGGPSQTNKMYERSPNAQRYIRMNEKGVLLSRHIWGTWTNLGEWNVFGSPFDRITYAVILHVACHTILLTYKVLHGSKGADVLVCMRNERNIKLARSSRPGSIISRTRIGNCHAHYPIIIPSGSWFQDHRRWVFQGFSFFIRQEIWNKYQIDASCKV